VYGGQVLTAPQGAQVAYPGALFIVWMQFGEPKQGLANRSQRGSRLRIKNFCEGLLTSTAHPCII
jgi:hypothetical protein